MPKRYLDPKALLLYVRLTWYITCQTELSKGSAGERCMKTRVAHLFLLAIPVGVSFSVIRHHSCLRAVVPGPDDIAVGGRLSA